MYNLKDIEDIGYSRGHQEEARRDCIDEFIKSINKEITLQEQESNFLVHEFSTFVLLTNPANTSLRIPG